MKCVCKKVSICLKCVFASRIDFSFNLVPLYTAMSKNAVWFTHVPYVTKFSIRRRDNHALGVTLGRYRFYWIIKRKPNIHVLTRGWVMEFPTLL